MPLRRQHQNTDVTYYLSDEGSVTKTWILSWAKSIQHSHPQGKVHTEMQWTLSRRFSDCSNWALLQHLQGCTPCAPHGLWQCQDRLRCHLPELGTAGLMHTRQRDEDVHTVYRWHSAQRRPKEVIAATSVSREAMRHPKLHFQNLLSPAAFGGLWEHSTGLSSCLWSLVSFCAYSQIKWVSRPKGFKLIPPKKNPLDPLKHFIRACKTTQSGTKYQRVLWSSSGNRIKYFIILSPTSTCQMSFYEVTINTKILCLFLMLLAK